jgi:hypothetical protein
MILVLEDMEYRVSWLTRTFPDVNVRQEMQAKTAKKSEAVRKGVN